jgi:hypothetical protein
MIGSNLLAALTEQITPHPEPVLSLYLDVNPANHANEHKAFVLRAREALKQLPLDKDFIEKILYRLDQELVIPQGRTLVIFAGADPGKLFAAHYLQADLPLLDLTDGALARWGRPFTAPLEYALDQQERYALLYVSEEHMRLFEVFLGQIEELADFVRIVDTDEWHDFRLARRHPSMNAFPAARASGNTSRADARLANATERIYRGLLPRFTAILKKEGINRIILLGLPEAISTFEALLPPDLHKLVVARLPGPPNPDAAAPEWHGLVKDTIRRVEEEHEEALLDRIRETGVWGFDETLRMLQDRRIHTLVAPWHVSGHVLRTEDGRVAFSDGEAQQYFAGEPYRAVPVMDVLPDLIRDSNANLEFAEGAAEVRLNNEFGGLARLKRW